MDTKRKVKIKRNTKETQISLELSLYGKGINKISTGIPFLDHMLELFSRHGFFDLNITAKGDIEIDYHHLVEDLGIALGQAFSQALGDKSGIKRATAFLSLRWMKLLSPLLWIYQTDLTCLGRSPFQIA